MSDNVIDLSKPFESVYKALDMKQQRKALNGAMRKEAKRVREEVVQSLHNSGIGQGTLTPLDKGIYTRIYPDKYGAGFMASIQPKNGKGIHVNRQMNEKPVLMWAESGTRPRHTGKRTSSNNRRSRFTGKKVKYYRRSGAYRGNMKPYHFMEDAERMDNDKVAENLFNQFQKNLERAAKKQGLL